jgi:transcriptional regulator with XRE-family HTH domain
VTTPPVKQLLLREEGLANRLRLARGNMMAKELAERAHWVQSKVSKIESGKQLPSRDDLSVWAELTDADADTLELWNAMLTEALQARRDWTARMREGGQQAVQRGFSELVAAASTLQFFETTFIPRFFQVPGYTRGIMTWVNQELGLGRDIDEAVAVRQADVNYLYSGKQFDLLITEPVLRWRHESMPVAVMRQQLDRLLSIDGLDNVRFGIIPMAGPVKVWPVHSFEIYGEVLMLETIYDEQRIEDEEKVTLYRHTFDRMRDSAVTGDAAQQLIHDAIRALPRN